LEVVEGGQQVIFKYADYARFMEHIKQIGNVVPLNEWDDSNKIILRHDVDFDIDAAYRLSLLEDKHQIRSTYFILATCCTYNPLSSRNRKTLRIMAAMGFEIGLHFDPVVYGSIEPKKLKRHVDQEADLLASIIDKPIQSISLHNPSCHNVYPIFEGYHNAYDKRIFSDDCYLSDSCMTFKGKDPFDFVNKTKKRPIQVLLHPLHYTEDGVAYPEIMFEHFKEYAAFIDYMFRTANETYAREMPAGLFAYLRSKEIH